MSIEAIRESDVERMTDEQVDQFLTGQGVGVLGLAQDGVPYLLPMSFGYDGEETLYFVYLLFGTDSHKQELTEEVRRARFLVYAAETMHEWRSLSLTGHVDSVDDDEWTDLRDAMENAWHPNVFSAASPMQGIEGYRFDIDDWTGIRSTG